MSEAIRIIATAIAVLATIPFAAAQPRRPLTVVHEFHVTEPGGEAIKTLNRLSKADLKTIIGAGCAALDHNCAKDIASIRPASAVTGMVIAEGENVYITGQVLKQQGEEWWGIYAAPTGYTVCRAALGTQSLSTRSIFNTTIVHNPLVSGLSFYAMVPSDRPEGRNWINAYFLIQYVPVGTETRLGCMTAGSRPWSCKGVTGCQHILGALD